MTIERSLGCAESALLFWCNPIRLQAFNSLPKLERLLTSGLATVLTRSLETPLTALSTSFETPEVALSKSLDTSFAALSMLLANESTAAPKLLCREEQLP